MPDSELARRMFAAMNHLEAELGRSATFAEIGELVAKAEPGQETPYAPSVVRRWIKAQQEPGTRSRWMAIASVLRVDPGWLAFGTGTMFGSDLDFDPEQDRQLKTQEIARARESAEREKAAAKPRRVQGGQKKRQ